MYRSSSTITTLLATLLLMAVVTHPASARDGAPGKSPKTLDYLQGVLLIKLKPDMPNNRRDADFGIAALDDVLHTIGASTRQPMFPLAPYPAMRILGVPSAAPDYGFERVYIIHYNSVYDAKAAAEMVAATGTVAYSEPHYIFPLLYTPNDPLVGQQAWLANISAQQAWDITKGDSSIVIGVCDTGVEWAHEDLQQNIVNRPGETGFDQLGRDKRTNGVDDDNDGYVDDWHGWDLVGNPTLAELQGGILHPDNDPKPTPMSGGGYEGYHGTWVSGCASGRADNAKGIAGIGFSCKILPIKCAADSVATNSVVAGYTGIRYGVDAGARIINCSWGGSGVPANQVQALQDVINYAYSKNVLVVAASGNAGTNNDVQPSYPANLNHVLSVGATTPLDSVASFSEYGFSVGVWAPGTGCMTTNVGGNQYVSGGVDGTSFSSPIVSGVAALVLSMHPTWTPDQVALQLRVTGDRVKIRNPAAGPLAYRRVNAFRAVNINQSFTGGTTMPGIGLVSFTINGKATDTISSSKPVVDVQLTLKNYLAPSNALQIASNGAQALKLVQPSYSIPPVGTLAQTTQTIQVTLDPASTVLYSEGTVQMMLKVTDGAYEDLIAVPIPVNLPGWHKRYDPASVSSTSYLSSDIHAASVDQAWVAANANNTTPVFSRTIDGGQSWTSYRPVVQTTEPVYCIFGLDGNKAWTGSGPSSGQAGVFRTTNGGNSWTRTAVSTITPFVDAVHFFNANDGILIGDPLSGKWGIGVTEDGGATWVPLTTPLSAASGTEAGWNGAYAAFGDNVWFGTNNSRIYHSADRGQTWTFGATPSINSLGIAFANANDGIALFRTTQTGGSYALAVSRNGGSSWQAIPMPFTGAFPSGVDFVPGTTRGWVATQNGVYETTDFGATWRPMAMPVIDFTGLAVSAASGSQGGGSIVSGFGVNSSGVLINLREVTSGVNTPNQGTASDASSLLVLYPNQPNPFSATTQITFELRKAAAGVSLLITDQTGRTVVQKDMGTMQTGMHTVTLQAGTLPAGTYYYTVRAGLMQASRVMTVVR